MTGVGHKLVAVSFPGAAPRDCEAQRRCVPATGRRADVAEMGGRRALDSFQEIPSQHGASQRTMFL